MSEGLYAKHQARPKGRPDSFFCGSGAYGFFDFFFLFLKEHPMGVGGMAVAHL